MKVFDSCKLPSKFYNIQSVIDVPPPKGEGIKILPFIFPKALLQQETIKDKFIDIPKGVREVLSMYRPTPLVRAKRLEGFLRLPSNVRIFYKREDVSPTGSHKLNTAIMQVFLAMKEGFERITTETGAGQWGSALAFACNKFGLKSTIYMVRCSYEQKPYRKVLMKIFGSEVIPSPSTRTDFGRKVLRNDPNSSGSLGIAISEALEDALLHEDTCYALGSVLNSVLMHQTIIGLEAKQQLKDVSGRISFVGCVGGGSNFGGLILPFIEDRLKGKEYEFIAVEPVACPSITSGKYKYDYGDTAKRTPLLKMYSLGYDFVPPPIHAGGLRYHGMAPIISLLVNMGIIKARAYSQKETFKAGITFARTEGIVPAPETCHAIKGAIDLALDAKRNEKEVTIVMGFSGHGLLDLKGYEDYMEGRLA